MGGGLRRLEVGGEGKEGSDVDESESKELNLIGLSHVWASALVMTGNRLLAWDIKASENESSFWVCDLLFRVF